MACQMVWVISYLKDAFIVCLYVYFLCLFFLMIFFGFRFNEPLSNCNDSVLPTLQVFITGASSLDYLMSKPIFSFSLELTENKELSNT